ncbi:hypothetical protein BJX63DRAFT_405144 [Aspergillus granulosus]|uniref:Uncharacterized protein n=1 Tax=Aspergillus granulosus TaxID=176169 RepID=A0ABR4H2Y6_9EURO
MWTRQMPWHNQEVAVDRVWCLDFLSALTRVPEHRIRVAEGKIQRDRKQWMEKEGLSLDEEKRPGRQESCYFPTP